MSPSSLRFFAYIRLLSSPFFSSPGLSTQSYGILDFKLRILACSDIYIHTYLHTYNRYMAMLKIHLITHHPLTPILKSRGIRPRPTIEKLPYMRELTNLNKSWINQSSEDQKRNKDRNQYSRTYVGLRSKA